MALNENGYHTTVMADLAAEEPCAEKNGILLRLPAGSRLSQCVFYRSDASKPGRLPRGTVDADSFGYRHLTELEVAGQDVEFKASSSIQFPYGGSDDLENALGFRGIENVGGLFLGPVRLRPDSFVPSSARSQARIVQGHGHELRGLEGASRCPGRRQPLWPW